MTFIFLFLGVMQYDIRLSRQRVPPKKTSYMCMVVDVPTEGDFHIIATSPLIDNDQAVKHMLLYGCLENGEQIWCYTYKEKREQIWRSRITNTPIRQTMRTWNYTKTLQIRSITQRLRTDLGHNIPYWLLYQFMAGAASQAGDADSSRPPGLTSGLQGSVNVHRGALLLVPQWQCISSFVFSINVHQKPDIRLMKKIYIHFTSCICRAGTRMNNDLVYFHLSSDETMPWSFYPLVTFGSHSNWPP